MLPQLTVAVEDALPSGVTMGGFSPDAVAVAVRRALGHVHRWADHVSRWCTRARVPAMHMALDEAMAESVGAGTRRPTLRVWEWGAPAVVIGSFQSLRNEVDPARSRRHGITVVRRISGGGAMFIEPGNTITYSLTVPASLVEGLTLRASPTPSSTTGFSARCELGIGPPTSRSTTSRPRRARSRGQPRSDWPTAPSCTT